MAIVPVHKRITETVLAEQGFSPKAIEIAMKANAEVDEKQGNEATETNLHGMRGFVSGRMQSENETRYAVAELLAQAKKNILASIATENNRYLQALEGLGAALHTVQDAAIHHFEPWPYTGIGKAVQTDPGYMLMHAVRDLCLTPYLDVGGIPLEYGGAGVAGEVGFSTYFSNRLFPDSIGMQTQFIAGAGRPTVVIGLINLCWGSCRGSGAPPAMRFTDPPSADTRSRSVVLQPKWAYELRIRPEVLQDAETKSREFISGIKQQAGDAWKEFVKL